MAGFMKDIQSDRDAGHSGTPYRVVSRPVPLVSGTNVPQCPVLSQMSRCFIGKLKLQKRMQWASLKPRGRGQTAIHLYHIMVQMNYDVKQLEFEGNL
jgi:hypothetical protein